MIAIPNTTFHQLIQQINAVSMAVGPGRIDELALRRIEKDARALLRVNQSEAFILLGALACIRGDYVSMHSHHKQAIQLGGGYYACAQYSVSLNRVGLFSDALKYAEIAHEINPMDSRIIEDIIGILLQIGLKGLVGQYAEKWSVLNPEKDPYISHDEIESFESEPRAVVSTITNNLLNKFDDAWAHLAKL
jgi:hypothetical protein